METRPTDPLYPDAKSKSAFQDGLEFQDFVCVQLLVHERIILQNTVSRKYQYETGESLQGYEIKLDRRCTETGRLSIEIAEKSREDMPNWTPSGIHRTDNTWLYIQGNYEVLFLLSKRWLRLYQEQVKPAIHELPTIRKFYLPFAVAEKRAEKVIRLRGGK